MNIGSDCCLSGTWFEHFAAAGAEFGTTENPVVFGLVLGLLLQMLALSSLAAWVLSYFRV
jgi:hypothetical protein